LIKLDKFYPNDFLSGQLIMLEDKLKTYIIDMHYDSWFSDLKGIAQLAKKIVATEKWYLVSFGNISFNFTGCYCYSWKSFFYNGNCEAYTL